MAAARFWEIGNEIAHTENITGPEADQAIILLTAAKSLNRQLVGAEPLLLKLAGHQASEDYSNELVVFWLQEYVSELRGPRYRGGRDPRRFEPREFSGPA